MSSYTELPQSTKKIVLQKLTAFEYFFVAIIVIYGGRANVFIENPFIELSTFAGIQLFWSTMPILISAILAYRWRVTFDKQYYYVLAVIVTYFIAISVKYHQIRPTILLNYIILITLVYITIRALKTNFLRIYELVVYNLAIIGIAMWALQTVMGGDSLLNIFSKIPGIDLFSNVSGEGLNAIIYSVQPFSYNLQNNFDVPVPRNCGFTWEPGAFAVYLCIAIFINLFVTDSNKKNIRFWILLSALITTQSTTGFTIFLVIVIFYYFNKNLNFLLLVFPMLIVIVAYIFTLPFMGTKIVNLGSETSEMEMIVESSIDKEEKVNPQRFVSFMIAFEDFIQNPVLGIIGSPEDSWTVKIDANISPISGVGNLLAQNGFAGFLFFLILSLKSSFYMARHFKYKGKYLFFMITLFISISYSIILTPLISSFWMFSIFADDEKKINN